MDLSELDKKYFIDPYIYNCPFCKRNNVSYSLDGYFSFDWSNEKRCFGYLIKCKSKGCEKKSLHLSWKELRKFVQGEYRGHYKDEFSEKIEIDKNIFYSRPSSSFIINENIPKVVRDLIFEAEQSRQSNLLVGGSACLRKAIYELINLEKTQILKKDGNPDYKESIKKLKEKFSIVDSELLDALGGVQELASDQLHEDSWKAWDIFINYE